MAWKPKEAKPKGKARPVPMQIANTVKACAAVEAVRQKLAKRVMALISGRRGVSPRIA